MKIESDRAEVLSGIRAGETLGSPIALLIRNRDWKNWQRTMHVGRDPAPDATGTERPPITRPRPGHADLAAAVKYERDDMRDVLERASARETAARVAAGALARQLLTLFDIDVISHVTRIGEIALAPGQVVSPDEIRRLAPDSPLRCVDLALERRMIERIDAAKAQGDTLGGVFEVVAVNVPAGLGSHVHWDRKLDGRLAQALMSIQAIKAVSIGLGAEAAARPGSEAHDEIVLPSGQRPASTGLGVARPTNRAGGLEGGITNGESLRVSAAMKPISTLMKPLKSVDLATMALAPAAIERSDVCAVPAAAVVGEAMVSLVLADAMLERFGQDSVVQMQDAFDASRRRIADRFEAPYPALPDV